MNACVEFLEPAFYQLVGANTPKASKRKWGYHSMPAHQNTLSFFIAMKPHVEAAATPPANRPLNENGSRRVVGALATFAISGGCHARHPFEEAGESGLFAEPKVLAYLLDGVVFVRCQQRLGTGYDVPRNPFVGTEARLFSNNLGEMLGRKATNAGIECHLVRKTMVLHQGIIKLIKHELPRCSFVWIVANMIFAQHAVENAQQANQLLLPIRAVGLRNGAQKAHRVERTGTLLFGKMAGRTPTEKVVVTLIGILQHEAFEEKPRNSHIRATQVGRYLHWQHLVVEHQYGHIVSLQPLFCGVAAQYRALVAKHHQQIVCYASRFIGRMGGDVVHHHHVFILKLGRQLNTKVRWVITWLHLMYKLCWHKDNALF